MSLTFKDKKTLGLKLFQVWTNLTTVLFMEGKVDKFGLKLRIEKTKVVTHLWQQTFLENCKKKQTFSVKFLQQNRKAGFVLKSGLISVQNGLV